MPITAERLEVDVQANTSDAKRDLDQFSRTSTTTGTAVGAAGAKAAGAGKRFSVMGGLVKAASGAMLGALAGKTIMAASDLNEQVSKTGIVFGPQAKIVTGAAQQMADDFGVAKSVFLEAAGGIGLVGKASGLTKKAAAGLSVDMGKLAADASSFYNVPVTEALDAMKSGLVGEAEPMRKFGVLLNEATVNAEAMALGIVKPVKNTVELAAAQGKAAQAQKAYTDAMAEHGQKSPEAASAALALQKAQEAVGKAAAGVIPDLTEGQKVQARSSLIMKGMADASGDLARTQDSVANRVKELQGRVVNFAADMGTKALPAVSKFLGILLAAPGKIKGAKDAVTGWVDAHPHLVTAMKVAAAVVTAVFIPAMVRAGVVATVTKVKVVASWIAQQIASAKAAAMVGVNMVKMGVFYVQYAAVTVAQTARVVASWIAQQVAAAVSVAKQIGSLVALAAAYVVNGAKMAASAALTAARVVAGWVLMGAQSMLQAARMAAAWVIAMGPLGWAIAAIVAIGVIVYKNWDKIKAATIAAWEAVSGALTKAWDKIKSVTMAGVNLVIGFVKNNWKKIVAILLGPLGIVVGLIASHWGQIKGFFSSGVQTIQNLWTNAWNKIKSTVTSGVAKVVGFVKGLPGKIQGVFSDAASWLGNAGTAVIEGFWNGLKAKWEDVKAWFGSVTDAIPNLKGPKAKDKRLLIENGIAVMTGFKEGLSDGWANARKYLQDVTKWVAKAAFPKDTTKDLQRRIKSVGERTRKLMQREANVTEKLAQAIQDHQDKVGAKAEFKDQVMTGITSQANVLNAGNSASAIAKSLEAQVTKAVEFAANLAKMTALGFSDDAIAQVASAGVEGGAETAAALAGASASEVASINASFTAIQSTATKAATTLANQLHDAGIATAQAVVDGLNERKDAIAETLKGVADGLKAAIKSAVEEATGYAASAKGLAAFDKAAKAKEAKKVKDEADQDAPGGSDKPGKGGGGGKAPKKPGKPTDRTGGGGKGGKNVQFNVTNHNPQAEPTSRSVNKGLDRAASLGLF